MDNTMENLLNYLILELDKLEVLLMLKGGEKKMKKEMWYTVPSNSFILLLILLFFLLKLFNSLHLALTFLYPTQNPIANPPSII